MSYTSKEQQKFPTKARWKFSDEELLASARAFKHRSEWKHGAVAHYRAAQVRGILDACCAHMTPMASPFAADYEIYAYEFTDAHVYVGLTFLPRARQIMHQVRGPVAEHAKVCPTFTRKVLEPGLKREEVSKAECEWIASYVKQGWTLLNKNKGGCTGSVRGRKWTKEAVLAEARKYKTKQEWIDKSQMSYRIAKCEGWFDEASAHMPKRVLGIGAGVAKTADAREKMRQAKLGKSLSAGHRAKIAASVSTSWKNKSARDVVEALLDERV